MRAFNQVPFGTWHSHATSEVLAYSSPSNICTRQILHSVCHATVVWTKMTLRNNQYSDAVLSGEADLVQERTFCTLFIASFTSVAKIFGNFSSLKSCKYYPNVSSSGAKIISIPSAYIRRPPKISVKRRYFVVIPVACSV